MATAILIMLHVVAIVAIVVVIVIPLGAINLLIRGIVEFKYAKIRGEKRSSSKAMIISGSVIIGVYALHVFLKESPTPFTNEAPNSVLLSTIIYILKKILFGAVMV